MSSVVPVGSKQKQQKSLSKEEELQLKGDMQDTGRPCKRSRGSLGRLSVEDSSTSQKPTESAVEDWASDGWLKASQRQAGLS